MVNSPHLGVGKNFKGSGTQPILPERRDLTMRGRWRRILFSSNRTATWKRVGRMALLGLVGVAGYVAWSYRQPVGAWLESQLADATGATVERIEIEGAGYTPRDELQKALELQKGASLVTYNTQAARARLESLPWVRLAAVERQLPDTLKVSLYEHVPLARVEADGQYWIANREGELITTDDQARFTALPLLRGLGAPRQAGRLLGQLTAWPNLSHQLREANWIGQRRWDLVFAGGLTVNLPEGDFDTALARLAELEQQRHVLSLPDGHVDLRLPDRIVLNLPETVTATPVVNAPSTTPVTATTGPEPQAEDQR